MPRFQRFQRRLGLRSRLEADNGAVLTPLSHVAPNHLSESLHGLLQAHEVVQSTLGVVHMEWTKAKKKKNFGSSMPLDLLWSGPVSPCPEG